MSELKNEGEGDRGQARVSESSSDELIWRASPKRSSDEPIWGTSPKRRRKRKRSYLNFAEVNKVFLEVSTKVACQLAEMTTVKPSKVFNLVPGATKEQIGAFLRIAEEDGEKPTEVVAPKEVVNPKQEGGTLQLEVLRKMALEGIRKSRTLDSPTQEES